MRLLQPGKKWRFEPAFRALFLRRTRLTRRAHTSSAAVLTCGRCAVLLLLLLQASEMMEAVQKTAEQCNHLFSCSYNGIFDTGAPAAASSSCSIGSTWPSSSTSLC